MISPSSCGAPPRRSALAAGAPRRALLGNAGKAVAPLAAADLSLTACAMGVVPVGVPKNAWGGNDQGSTPWKDAALAKLQAGLCSDKAPAQFSATDGINFTEIAKLNPDVVLGASSGLTEEDYKKSWVPDSSTVAAIKAATTAISRPPQLLQAWS